jgi:Flp pilus assembly pilin Flp
MNAMVKAQSRKALKRGQGMTEYIIIVALIAIAAIGVVTLFGDNIRKLFGASANALAGGTNEKNSGGKANTSLTNKGMKNFGQNNAY